ncbi:YggS family pyridoxal phosphate-dependent enzyme [Elongatibacter sediminis]|uniref:Pyridoxal phosphate homeostasis protein n=1 Tax=Elongatibacter sediminis TaxID=3119006 RepID=A0AAW9RQJ9_9GAMM
MNDLKAKLEAVHSRIANACRENGRNPADVRLLAVGKGHPASAVEALRAAGQRAFGENYVQEALAKVAAIGDPSIEWHFIGPLQSNKTADVARTFAWVQSVDREKLLRRLSAQRPASLPPLNICLQVNIDREPQKAGALPESVPALAQLTEELPGLALRGLMAIPKPASATHDPMPSFAAVAELLGSLQDRGYRADTLSLGMSGDLETAIRAGSTLVRVGTDLFGPRPAQKRFAQE